MRPKYCYLIFLIVLFTFLVVHGGVVSRYGNINYGTCSKYIWPETLNKSLFQCGIQEQHSSSNRFEFSFGRGDITDASITFFMIITIVVASIVLYFMAQSRSKEIGKVAQSPRDQELLALQNQNRVLMDELQSVQTQRADSDQQWRVFCDEKQRETERLGAALAESEQRLESSSYGEQETAKELDSIRLQLADAQDIVQLRHQELDQLKMEKQEYQQKYEEELKRSKDAQLRFDEIEQSKNEMEEVVKQAEIEIAQLKEVVQEYERNQNEGGSAGAGSGGWSDFGENDEFEEKVKEETTPESSQVGVVQNSAELAVLNKKIGDLERELVKTRVRLEKKHEEKIREVEAEMNRWQKEYKKLETKSFHEVLKLKQELENLQALRKLESFTNKSLNVVSPLDDPIWGEPEYPPTASGGRSPRKGFKVLRERD